jgi:hypothetical protein
MPADALPQMVVASVGDRSPVAVPQELFFAGRTALASVLLQVGHQGRRHRLPTVGAAFLA